MCDLTAIITNPRFAQVRTADRYVVVQMYLAPWLLQAPLKVLSASLCKAEKATQNFLTRATAAGCFTGEVGSLQTTDAYQFITASSASPAPPVPLETPVERPSRPTYESDLRYNERRRQERGGVLAESRRTTPTDSARAGASSGTGFGVGPDSLSKTESGTEPDAGEMIAALQSLGMEAVPAAERVKEFGAQRVSEALEYLRYLREKEKVDSPCGVIVDFLVEERPLPAGVYAMREKEQRIRERIAEQERIEALRQQTIAESEAQVARALAIQAQKRAQEANNGQVERMAAGTG
jgi:cytochrome c-type biogenesis protein CcmH/NrfF